MKKLPFRTHHTIQLLEHYESKPMPLDYLISCYFRENTSLGSKDRAAIAEAVYGMIRWKGLIDHLCNQPVSWLNRLMAFEKLDPSEYLSDSSIPLADRVSFPPLLFDQLVRDYGEEKAIELCMTCNAPAPTTIRVNLLKTTREALLAKWNDTHSVSPCKVSPEGIVFHQKIHFSSLPEFKEGLFEVQDEGSQLLAKLVQAKPGDHVLDFCSGSGGKTLAIAPGMQHKGQLYLHDIRASSLHEAKKRLKRAGVQNAQCLTPESPQLKTMKGRMDWVLVDAPCSGTGTLRRNPDMKWRFDESTVPHLTGLQKDIFSKALKFVKPGGKIVYSTCSLLKQENDDQVDYFIKTYGLTLATPVLRTLPAPGEMDGFFGAIFELNSNLP